MMVTIDDDVVQSTMQAMPSKVARAIVRAMNRAIASSRTEMVSLISRDTGLRSKDVRDALPLRSATLDRPEAGYKGGLKRIPLIHFKATGPEPSRGRGRGVSYRLPQGRNRLSQAFIATMASGHRGVFMRKKDSKRLPIRELHGPSLGHVFAKFRPAGLAKLRAAFDTNFTHEMGRTNA